MGDESTHPELLVDPCRSDHRSILSFRRNQSSYLHSESAHKSQNPC